MLEKYAEAVFAYCFATMSVFDAFFERTHAVIGTGLPLLFMVGIHLYLPFWGEVGILVFVIAPAAAGMFSTIVHGLLLTQRR